MQQVRRTYVPSRLRRSLTAAECGCRLPGEARLPLQGRQKGGDMDRLRGLSRCGRLLLALVVGGAVFGIASAVGERTLAWASARECTPRRPGMRSAIAPAKVPGR